MNAYFPKMITLCGMMGCGKSAHGRQLAKQLGRPFLDLDQEIERVFGKAVHAIFAQNGEAAFRAAEREILAKLLFSESAVIALGGGALQDESNARFIRENSILCFIDAPFDSILDRVQRNTRRPLLLNENGTLKTEEEIRNILLSLDQKRRPLYETAQIHFRPHPNAKVWASVKKLIQQIDAHSRKTEN
ncbi:MAG: shikimate kinase [Candidatus Cyclonatronum sp.]|uniref:shikimate kinase n=1 Tax=Cyclonatronum sp. TaxID=3024185 RepID=UPI0025BAEFC1|nr:shikimate kinase [Cyclonatronum sp.]MCH8485752.1 shikimate kinase [Cyclonatronum sp.]